MDEGLIDFCLYSDLVVADDDAFWGFEACSYFFGAMLDSEEVAVYVAASLCVWSGDGKRKEERGLVGGEERWIMTLVK